MKNLEELSLEQAGCSYALLAALHRLKIGNVGDLLDWTENVLLPRISNVSVEDIGLPPGLSDKLIDKGFKDVQSLLDRPACHFYRLTGIRFAGTFKILSVLIGHTFHTRRSMLFGTSSIAELHRSASFMRYYQQQLNKGAVSQEFKFLMNTNGAVPPPGS